MFNLKFNRAPTIYAKHRFICDISLHVSIVKLFCLLVGFQIINLSIFALIKSLLILTVVAKAVPLSAALGVKGQNVIVDSSMSIVDHLMLKSEAFKGWKCRFIDGPVERNANSCGNLGRSFLYSQRSD
jgi:hypothetical protein